MNEQFVIADCARMNERKLEAEKFYNAVLDPYEIPFIVTDEASLYAIYCGDELELIKKVKEKYGIDINSEHFRILFWKLIDLLEKKDLF